MLFDPFSHTIRQNWYPGSCPCRGWSRDLSTSTRRESAGTFEGAGTILRRSHGDLIVSRRKLRQADVIELVRDRRENANQTLGFASRPFVLCGLPVRKPKRGEFLHERRNGRFLLQVTGHPGYGLPWGQDRLVPTGRVANPPRAV